MDHLYGALLSSNQEVTTKSTSLDNRSRDEADVRQCAARGEFEELRGAALFNRTWHISNRYCNIGDGVDSLQNSLHSLWYIYYQLSCNASHETPDHDRLVLDVIRIQGRGLLTRPAPGPYGVDVARTVEGVLWNDLPFLVTDMTEFWTNNCASLSGMQRLNFASFLAKLASTRVSKDRLCQIALILFRSTFEEARNMGTAKEPDNEDRKRSVKSLDVAHLLPAACVWIKEAGYNLIQLSDVSWNDCPGTIGQGGRMFVQSDLGNKSPNGFSPWRWMYWLKRLHELQDEAKSSGEQRLEGFAADAIDCMISNVEERNSEILRAYQTGGDVLHQDQHLGRLGSLVKVQASTRVTNAD